MSMNLQSFDNLEFDKPENILKENYFKKGLCLVFKKCIFKKNGCLKKMYI